jgi:hypothetical protein
MKLTQLPLDNRLILKQELLTSIASLPRKGNNLPDSPITDLNLDQETRTEIDNLTKALENLNPTPKPLLYGLSLLDGSWRLLYSTGQEIRRLEVLPFGFKLGKIFQNIDLASASFENKAFLEDRFSLLKGYVRVTATFEPELSLNTGLPDRKINVNFLQRFLSIQKLVGFGTPMLDPVKVVSARNPVGRTPSLEITYLDDTLRIGRGGEGSLFILTR